MSIVKPTTSLVESASPSALKVDHGGNHGPRTFAAGAIRGSVMTEPAALAETPATEQETTVPDRATNDDARVALHIACANKGVLLEITDGPRITEPVIRCANGAGTRSYFVPASWPLSDAAARFPAELERWNANHSPAADDSPLHKQLRDALHQAHMGARAGGFEASCGADATQHREHLLTTVQAYAQYWGCGHGRTLEGEYAAQLAEAAAFLSAEAVAVSLAGLQTNPHDVADKLHRATDRAQAAHLARVGEHAPQAAYSSIRFGTANDAIADALATSVNRRTTIAGLRQALDMAIEETDGTLAPADYVPPMLGEDAEEIRTVGASGAILLAALYTPTDENGADRPQVLAVYSDTAGTTTDELDRAGALDLKAQLLAFLPKLDAMIDALPAEVAVEPPKSEKAQQASAEQGGRA